VVAVFAAMQTSPRCIMVHRESGISSLRDLKDITLSLGAGKGFATFLEKGGYLSRVKVVPYTGSVAPFMVDKSFAQQAYVFSEPLVVRNEGADPVTLLVSELGFDPYTSCLITHEDTIRTRPELVRAMVQATQVGWTTYFKDAAKTHERILRENKQMDLASLNFGQEALRTLCLPPDTPHDTIGRMDATRWETLAKQLVELGLIDDASAWQSAFDLRFLAVDPQP
jgi:NitT/TauT family transport system substrate-binding protein